MPKIAIVIPSYIKADSPNNAVETDGFKMLKRALGSLEILKGDEVDVILPFCIEGKEMGIRNCGLIFAHASGAEVVIFLDNDEVVDTPDFLDIAIEGLLEQINGWKMDGKGGFYISKSGEIYEKTVQPWWQMAWRKAKLFEEVWKGILNNEERFVESPIVLGGNLVLTRRLFEKIPFDPLVPRGEDIDYLINARISGFMVSKGRFKDAVEVYTYLGPLFKKLKDRRGYERFKQRWATFMEFIRNDGLKDVLREGSL